MKAYIATCIIGVFGIDENKNILTYRLFDKNPEKIAEKLSSEIATPEERQVLDDLLKAGYKEVVSEKKIELPGVSITAEKENIASIFLKEEFRKLAIDLQFAENQAELNQLLSAVNIELTKTKLQRVKKDKIIMHVIGIIDDLDKMSNTLSERLREWYGLHAPELSGSISSHEKFAEIVNIYGHRDEIKDKMVKNVRNSAGMEFDAADVKNVQSYAKEICRMYTLREDMAKYLESLCVETIPNLTEVTGHLLASRLLQLAGGLEKISRMPSSTIQLLGSEKALFRHMKGQGSAPKYGVIYQHSLIQNAQRELRGKVARLIAAKLTLAAKLDAYSDKNQGRELREKLEKQVRGLKPVPVREERRNFERPPFKERQFDKSGQRSSGFRRRDKEGEPGRFSRGGGRGFRGGEQRTEKSGIERGLGDKRQETKKFGMEKGFEGRSRGFSKSGGGNYSENKRRDFRKKKFRN